MNDGFLDNTTLANRDVGGRRAFIASMTSIAAGGLMVSGCGPAQQAPPDDSSSSVAGKPYSPKKSDLRPAIPDREPLVRIRNRVIRVSDTTKAPEIVLGNKGQRLWVTTPELQRPGRVMYGPLTIEAANGGWSLKTSGRRRNGLEQIKTATPLAIAPIGPHPISYQGRPLLGTLRLIRRNDRAQGDFDVVSHLPMESYLPGVLELELFSSWPSATFAAQAIAARSFAVCERAFWISRRHYDMVAGQASQAWTGGTASSSSLKAVQATHGQLLTWDKRVVPSYYSSACGGLPASAIDEIGPNPMNNIPPLSITSPSQKRLVNCCSGSPRAKWNYRGDLENMRSSLVKWAKRGGLSQLKNLTSLHSITVAARNPVGRPTRYVIRGSVRVECSPTELRRGLQDLRTSAGKKIRLTSDCLEFTPIEGGFRIDGRGNGHGVGLCQYGAAAMGKAGRTSQDILARYYPGATVVTAWDQTGQSRQYANS